MDRLTASIRTPDIDKMGTTTSRSDVDRPKGDPEGARRAAPSNPSAGKSSNQNIDLESQRILSRLRRRCGRGGAPKIRNRDDVLSSGLLDAARVALAADRRRIDLAHQARRRVTGGLG